MPAPPGPDTGICRPRRPGVLGNPRSGRFARHADAIRSAVRCFPGGLYREGCQPGEIGQALGELLAGGADIIIVLGGDGTLQAVLDHLPVAAGGEFPPLAIVPFGSTNMSALDLGFGQAPRRILEGLRRRLEEGAGLPLVARPAVQICRQNQPTLRGMFFGAGLITTGVRYFREHLRGHGLTGEAASAIAVCRMLLRLGGGVDTGGATPLRAHLSEDGCPAADGSFLLLFASTLNRLLLGTRPWWGSEPAPMHVTAIRDRPRRLWRSLPALARGDGANLLEPDFRSRNLHVLDLQSDADFVLDGEIHAGQPGQRLRIDTAGPFRFAVPQAR